MNRFFVEPSAINELNQSIRIEGEDLKHISKVLRLKEGDMIEVCDGVHWEYAAKIEAISKDVVIAHYEERHPFLSEAPIVVRLYQGVPKATKMDLIIQKTTEMGIVEIIPVTTKRTVVQFHNDKDEVKKTERWQKIALEAAKQSKRGKIPHIHQPMTLEEALQHSEENDFNLLAYEKENQRSLKDALQSIKDTNPGTIGIWIGPEGGFDEMEIIAAEKSGIKTVTLGPRILRTETAGFALLSIIMYELGDLGGF